MLGVDLYPLGSKKDARAGESGGLGDSGWLAPTLSGHAVAHSEALSHPR
jgi:hypothetical protein